MIMVIMSFFFNNNSKSFRTLFYNVMTFGRAMIDRHLNVYTTLYHSEKFHLTKYMVYVTTSF